MTGKQVEGDPHYCANCGYISFGAHYCGRLNRIQEQYERNLRLRWKPDGERIPVVYGHSEHGITKYTRLVTS